MLHSMGRFMKSFPGLVIMLVMITLLGAVIFQKVEAPYETHTRTHVSKTRQKIFLLAQQLSKKGENADWSKLVTQVDRYREKLYESWLAGTDELTIDIPNKWSFWGSIYYCFTLFTTIGYGNIFPSTAFGKLITLIYGMIAIPMCSLIISRLSNILIKFTKAIYLLTLDPSGVPVGLREAYHRADTSFDFRILPCIVAFILYLTLGAGVYSYVAGMKQLEWSILDAVYFAFISITTVGFGDLVPDTYTFMAILSIIYILVGLAITGIIFGRLTMGFDMWLNQFGDQANLETDAKVLDAIGNVHHVSPNHLKQT